MNFDNLQVKHRSFGDGTIIDKQGNYLTVKFADTQKIFVYPDIFEKFLTLADGTVSDEIKSDLLTSKKAKEEITNNKIEENRRAMSRGIVVPGDEFNSFDNPENDNSLKNTEPEEI